jgi:serine/threonine protein kinase
LADAAFRELIALLGDALELPTAERDPFLVERCGDNPALLAEARNLLALQGSRSEVDITAVVWDRMLDAACRVAGPASHPSRIGPYQVTGLLGEGGMGVVYSARQEQPIRRDLAVKVLRSGLATPRAMARFELERQTLARLDHPGIARVYDAGATDEGLPYLAMEWVHGEPIARYCARNSASLASRLALMRQVCLAVHHAHQKGVIHRNARVAVRSRVFLDIG